MISVAIPGVGVPVNLAKAASYKKTKCNSEQWLTSQLGEDKMKEIKATKYDNAGILALNSFLKKNKIDNTSVEPKTEECIHEDRVWDVIYS
jgi:hypothetical protein